MDFNSKDYLPQEANYMHEAKGDFESKWASALAFVGALLDIGESKNTPHEMGDFLGVGGPVLPHFEINSDEKVKLETKDRKRDSNQTEMDDPHGGPAAKKRKFDSKAYLPKVEKYLDVAKRNLESDKESNRMGASTIKFVEVLLDIGDLENVTRQVLQEVGDFLAEGGAVHLFKDYFDIYSEEKAKLGTVDWMKLYILLKVCLKFSAVSDKLSEKIANCGILFNLVAFLEKYKDTFQQHLETEEKIILMSASLLHELSLSGNNEKFFKDIDVVDLLSWYALNTKGSMINEESSLSVCCTLILVRIFEKEIKKTVAIDEGLSINVDTETKPFDKKCFKFYLEHYMDEAKRDLETDKEHRRMGASISALLEALLKYFLWAKREDSSSLKEVGNYLALNGAADIFKVFFDIYSDDKAKLDTRAYRNVQNLLNVCLTFSALSDLLYGKIAACGILSNLVAFLEKYKHTFQYNLEAFNSNIGILFPAKRTKKTEGKIILVSTLLLHELSLSCNNKKFFQDMKVVDLISWYAINMKGIMFNEECNLSVCCTLILVHNFEEEIAENVAIDEGVSSNMDRITVEKKSLLFYLDRYLNEAKRDLHCCKEAIYMGESAIELVDLLSKYHAWMRDRYESSRNTLQKVGDYLAENGGAVLFKFYIDIYLSEKCKFKRRTTVTTFCHNSKVWKNFCKLLDVCLNFADKSVKLSEKIAAYGILSNMIDLLEKYKGSFSQNLKTEGRIILYAANLLYNCSLSSNNKIFFKDKKAVELISWYANNMREIKIPGIDKSLLPTVCMLILAHTKNEEDRNDLIATDDEIISYILQVLNEALLNNNHRSAGFSAQELTLGLTKLANNEQNSLKILRGGALISLGKLIKTDNFDEEIAAVKCIQALLFVDENKSMITKETEVMKKLEELQSHNSRKLQLAASGTLWVLRGFTPSEHEPKPILHEDKHVMLSYNWDHQNVVKQIRDRLKASGYNVWMDVDHMRGNMLDAMAQAVEKSAVVLICMSQKYKDSSFCKLEASYACKLKKDIIPLRLQRGFDPDGWLGLMTAMKLYIDFSDSSDFDNLMKKLIEEIGDRGKITGN